MTPATNLYPPPSGLSYEVLQRAKRDYLNGRPRLPSLAVHALPPGHERILVKALNNHGYINKGDLLIFDSPARRTR